jgi:hypothetical protein
MNCRDTERLWNDLLDTPTDAAIELESALEAHAEICPTCAPIAARYRTLRAALLGWKAKPVASPEFLAKLEAASKLAAILPFENTSIWTSVRRLAAAAAILLAVFGGWRLFRPTSQPEQPPEVARIEPTPYSITDSFVEVTSATIDLARETSAPAGRVGRNVLASTTLPDASVELRPQVSVIPSTEVLKSVGGRVGATVRPLSGSARQAFGFLIRAAAQEDRSSPRKSTPRGI